jgi:hypothetical protein
MAAMAELVGELMTEAARARGLSGDALAQITPLANALTGAVVALVDWWRGLEQLLEGRLWMPPEWQPGA